MSTVTSTVTKATSTSQSNNKPNVKAKDPALMGAKDKADFFRAQIEKQEAAQKAATLKKPIASTKNVVVNPQTSASSASTSEAAPLSSKLNALIEPQAVFHLPTAVVNASTSEASVVPAPLSPKYAESQAVLHLPTFAPAAPAQEQTANVPLTPNVLSELSPAEQQAAAWREAAIEAIDAEKLSLYPALYEMLIDALVEKQKGGVAVVSLDSLNADSENGTEHECAIRLAAVRSLIAARGRVDVATERTLNDPPLWHSVKEKDPSLEEHIRMKRWKQAVGDEVRRLGSFRDDADEGPDLSFRLDAVEEGKK